MKKIPNSFSSSFVRKAALVSLAAQLSAGFTGTALAQSSQTLVNDSLPLPEFNSVQLEKLLKAKHGKAEPSSTANAHDGSLPLSKVQTASHGRGNASPTADQRTSTRSVVDPDLQASAKSVNSVQGSRTTAALTKPAATTTAPTITNNSVSSSWMDEALPLRKELPVAVKQPAPTESQTTVAETPRPTIDTQNTIPVSTPEPPTSAPLARTPSEQALLRSEMQVAETKQETASEPKSRKHAKKAEEAEDTSAPEIVMRGIEPNREPAADAPLPESSKETSAPTTIASSAAPESAPAAVTTDAAPAKLTETTEKVETTTAEPTTKEKTESTSAPAPSKDESSNNNNSTTSDKVSMLTPSTESGVPIFIDNDEETQQEMTIQYEDLPTDESGSKVKVGAQFPIVVTSEITSKTAKEGDPVHGRLKFDLKIGSRLVAEKGSVVRGHINYALKARTPMRSLVSTDRWYRNSGCLGIAFDEIINGKGEHIPLVAEPARQALYVKNKGEGRELGINHKGQITGPWSQQLKYKAVRIGMNAALAPVGAMSFGAMPVALGVMGAVNPSFAFMKPVGTNVRHRRIKGFVWGALSGVPGSWLIEDTTVKGQEAVIKPGDEFLAEMRQEFTGEPGNDAEIMAGGNRSVKGEVVKHKKKT